MKPMNPLPSMASNGMTSRASSFHPPGGKVVLERVDCVVPDEVRAGPNAVVPFQAGETLAWRYVGAVEG